MLLKIDVKPEDIIFNENGRIIIKVKRYGQFTTAAHLATTDGETKTDFDKAKGKGNKSVFVGINGGISVS